MISLQYKRTVYILQRQNEIKTDFKVNKNQIQKQDNQGVTCFTEKKNVPRPPQNGLNE